MKINNSLSVKIKDKTITLEKGFYIYVGSAFGTGGITSRIHRHLRRDKKQHWHIDQVTSSDLCQFYGVAVFSDERTECSFSRKLENLESLTPIIDFGNSDCKNSCSSHFFQIKN